VVTIGAPHIPGQTRLDLLEANAAILCPLVQELDRVAPDANVIIVSNPVDVLTRIALETSTRSEHLILAQELFWILPDLVSAWQALNVDKYDVHVQVIKHGDSQSRFGQMLPLA